MLCPQVNLKEQGQLRCRDEFIVCCGRKKYLRHIFLFEDLILFSKTRKVDGGYDIYTYKQSFKVTRPPRASCRWHQAGPCLSGCYLFFSVVPWLRFKNLRLQSFKAFHVLVQWLENCLLNQPLHFGF